MEPIAHLRREFEKPAKDVDFRRDAAGRLLEISGKENRTRLNYNSAESQEANSVDVFDRSGKHCYLAGRVFINDTTGDVTVREGAADKFCLARRDTVIHPSSYIESNEYNDSGLRTEQKISAQRPETKKQAPFEQSYTTQYGYLGADNQASNDPLKVKSALALTTDSKGLVVRMQNFDSLAGVELGIAEQQHVIERSARSNGVKLKSIRSPGLPQQIQQQIQRQS